MGGVGGGEKLDIQKVCYPRCKKIIGSIKVKTDLCQGRL